MEEVKEHFPDLVFKSIVPRNVRLSESPSHGMPILFYDATSSGSVAYENLAKEILEKDIASAEIDNKNPVRYEQPQTAAAQIDRETYVQGGDAQCQL